jgi:serine phosphatase RsbU (regulator of sigma subunit)
MGAAGERRWALIGVAAATLVGAVDAALGPRHVFITAVVVGPALAAVACGPGVTAAVGAYALVLAVVVGHFVKDIVGSDELVRYAAIAVVTVTLAFVAARRSDRERRLAEVTRVAEVAQRTILRALPERIGRYGFAVRYLSASHEALVGGDFYDTVLTVHGVRAMVGDVRGKGLDAVQVAVDVLGAFRAAAHLDTLEDVVVAVDAAVAGVAAAEDFVTAVFVQLNPDATFSIVNCGHPPPLLLRPNATFVEGGRTRPLGLEPEPDGVVEAFGSGQRVLLYTDGLVEARNRGGVMFGLDDDTAAALTRGSLAAGLDALVVRLLRHVGGDVSDDVALLLTESTNS